MRRFLIQIDDDTYDSLRKRSFEEKRSMASIVRECLDKSVERPSLTLDDFPWVGSGRSKQGKLAPVSENHDEAFVEAILPNRRRK